jgi:hypothetical protein
VAVNISNVQPARIVRVNAFPNKDGREPENRRVFVVSVSCKPDDEHIIAAGITTKQRDHIEPNCIELPHRPDGTCETGLTRPSLLVCDWTHKVPLSEICEIVGRCPRNLRDDIFRRLKWYAAQKLGEPGRIDIGPPAELPVLPEKIQNAKSSDHDGEDRSQASDN